MQPIIYSIPKNTEVIFVADAFAEQYIGGAELTLQALVDKCPKKYFKANSELLTPELIEANKDKYWILGNIARLSKNNIIHIATTAKRFSKIECDYLYCKFRSSHLHKLQTGKECDCHKQDQGRFVLGLYKRAQHVFFMSHGQLNEYKRLFPAMRGWPKDKLIVQSSVFSEKELGILDGLYHARIDKLNIEVRLLAEKKIKKEDSKLLNTWMVLGGGTWIKNQQQTEKYCKDFGLDYEVIGGLKPEEFLRKMSEYSGLVFHPRAEDSCPRLTIEAMLLGLNLDLNNLVQHKDEEWFQERRKALTYLQESTNRFWKVIGL